MKKRYASRELCPIVIVRNQELDVYLRLIIEDYLS